MKKITQHLNSPLRILTFALIGVMLISAVAFGSMYVGAAANANKTIGLERASAIALEDAGYKADQVQNFLGKLEKEDGVQVYDIDFDANGFEYDYTIKASDGKILEANRDEIDELHKETNDKEAPQGNENPQSKDGNAQVISLADAKEIAFNDAGVNEASVTVKKAELDKDDHEKDYDIEFYNNTTKWEYEIDAFTGKIIDKEAEKIKTHSAPSTPSTPSEPSSTLIGVSAAKAIAIKDAGISEAAATFKKVKLDTDDGMQIYDVEFYSEKGEFEYEINAKTGKIVERDIEYFKNTSNNSSSVISSDKAKSIALSKAGLSSSQVYFEKAELDEDDGMMVYEIEFKSGNTEYEFEIDAKTGKILDMEIDRDDD